MLKKIGILIGLMCFTIAAYAASDTIIDDIKVQGLTTVEEKEILDNTSYGIGMTFSTYKTREDIKRLYRLGKFDDIKVELETVDGKNILVFNVTEKKKVSKIIISGNDKVGDGDIKGKFEIETDEAAAPQTTTKDPDEDEIKEKIKEGEHFDEYILKKVIVQIEKMYKEKNFYYVKVGYEIATGEKDGVDIKILIEEGSKVKVKKITAKGNSVFGVDKIKGLMETKEEGWFVSGVFDDDKFIEDLKKIVFAYYEEGYVKAKINGYSLEDIEANKKQIIKDYVVIDKDTNFITIEIPVAEGIQYKIKTIKFEGNELFDTEKFVDRMQSKEKRVFDKKAFEMDKAYVRNMYSEKGYIFAQIKDAYVYDDDTGDVDISLTIAEGPVAYINEIKLRGNYVTKDKVILRELLMEPEDPFDSSKIKKTQERIYNLGFFDNVVIDTEQVDIDRLNLVFEVTERKTNTIGLGAGYSTVEGLVGYLQLTNANLFGEGKSFSADVQFGNTKRSWQLGYKDPWFYDIPTSFGVDIWNTFKDKGYNSQGYDLDTYGLNLSFGRRFGTDHKTFLTYRFQEDKYSNIDANLVEYVAERTSRVSSLTPMYVYDTRDNVFDPGRGMYNSMSLQIGGGVLGGDYNYLKGIWDFRYFVPSIWKFVLAIHTRVGNGWGYDSNYGGAEMPPTEKFYCGGTDTVRGYGERSLGPLGGGNFTIVSNIEYKVKLVERMLTAAVFYDSGNCWNNASDVDWANPYLYPSAGVGIRFTIPGTVMMIRLDWGYALDPVVRATQFGESGKIHFNIGNIF